MRTDPDLDRRLEPVRFLAGTPARPRILDALADGPLARDDLKARLDVPRTTLRRNLAELTERHWVVHDAVAGEYRLTAAGRRARRGFDDAVDTLDTAARAGAFLREFPESLPLDAEDLGELTVSLVTDGDPHRPVRWVRSHLEGTDLFRGFVPVVNPVYVQAVRHLLSDGFRFDIVGSESAYETLAREHPEKLETMRTTDGLSMTVSTDVPDYGLAILEEYVLLTAYDDRMRPHAVARARRSFEPLAEWATDRFESVAESATPAAEWEP